MTLDNLDSLITKINYFFLLQWQPPLSKHKILNKYSAVFHRVT